MTTLEQQVKNLEAEAGQLRKKAKEQPAAFTETDANRAETVVKELEAKRGQLDGIAKASKVLRELPEGGGDASGAGAGPVTSDHPSTYGRSGANSHALTKTTPFTQSVVKAFNAAAPTIGGPAVSKQIVDSGSLAADIPEYGETMDGRTAITGLPRVGLSMLDIIESFRVDAPEGTYLRQTTRENNADTVPAGEMKPVSQFELTPARWRMATIAHLSNPVRLQWLTDYSGLETLITSDLVYGVDARLSEFVLTGGQDEEGEEVDGLLTVDGVATTSFRESMLRTIRAAIGQLEVSGVQPAHIVMSPADWEEIEVLQTADDAYLLRNAPESRPRKSLWGLTVVTPPDMGAGEAIVGDLSTVKILHRGSHQVTWNEGTAEDSEGNRTDLFRHNLVRFRDEVRAALQIGSLQAFRRVELQDGGE